MKKRSIKIISFIILILFIFNVVLPTDLFAEMACWNDGSLANEAGGPPVGTGNAPPLKPSLAPTAADPVNLATGAFQYNHQDLILPSRILPLEITRFYYSSNAVQGPFGRGWSHNYNIYLIPDVTEGADTYVIRVQPNGDKDKFQLNTNGSYASPAGCYDTLVKNTNQTFTITEKHGLQYNFTSAGLLSSIVDRNGNTITLTYDTSSRLSEISDALSRSITLTYNSNNRITQINDSTGRDFTYAYDSNNNLASFTTPAVPGYTAGLTTAYSYDNSQRLICITDPKGSTYLTNYYDDSGRVIRQDYGPAVNTFSYAAGKTTLTDYIRCIKTEYYINSDATIQQEIKYYQTWSPDWITTYEYDSNKNITKIIYPQGNSVENTYDSKGNLLTVTRTPPEESSEDDIVTTFTYESSYNFVETLTDSNGNTTTYDYDTAGNLTSIAYPQINSTTPTASFTYNQYGQLLTATDPAGTVTQYAYNSSTGYLTSVTADYGTGKINAQTGFTYDSKGNILTVTDPLSHTTTFTYDALNRLTQTEDALTYLTKYTYDQNSNLIKLEKQSNSGGTTWQISQYDYDILDRLITVTELVDQTTGSNDRITHYQYDTSGNKTSVTDANNHTTSYTYDERDLLRTVTDPLNGVTEYTYDDNANLAQIEDANNHTTTYEYDGFDRLSKTTYADSTYEQYTYDSNSNLLTKRTRKAQTLTYAYDVLNRLTTKTYPNSSTAIFEYDLASRLTEAANSSSTLTYTYDNLNRVLSAGAANNGLASKTISYEYDATGKRTKLTYPDSSYITYTYDAVNRLTAVKDSSNNNIAAYTYDTLNRRTQSTLVNGTEANYIYDGLNNLTSLVNKITGGADISSFSHTYDKMGNKLTKTTSSTTNYTYDYINQLTQVSAGTATSYAYDHLGNRTTAESKSYTSNNLNQYTAVDSNSLAYDDNGNLLTYNGWTYTYDYENRLVGATDGTTTASYLYDPFGRRIAKTVGSTTINFFYDGDSLIAEYDSSNTFLRSYIYSDSIDEPISLYDGSSTCYYDHDSLGSISELTDNTGAVIEKYSYDAFGNTTIKDPSDNTLTQSAYGNRYGFTGREYDTETGLYHYRARAYAPEIGRFVSVDPLETFNLISSYDFCYNNTLSWVDPYGLDTYIVNISLVSGKPTDYNDPLSHTFTFTTNGQEIEHTYSWGNEEFAKGERRWRRDDQEDVELAKKALKDKFAEKIADDVLDKYVEKAYPVREKEDRHPWLYWRNCKHETRRLLQGSIDLLKEENSKLSYGIGLVKQNSVMCVKR